VFANNAFKNGNIEEDEYKLFKSYFDKVVWSPDLTLMLNVSPRKCLARIKTRNRSFEQNIDMQYLDDLDKQYRDMAYRHNFIVINDDDDDHVIDDIVDEIVDIVIEKIDSNC
jgi:deoxyadenosine/deoxycytidine kinase